MVLVHSFFNRAIAPARDSHCRVLFSLLPGPLFAGSSIAFSAMAAVPSFKRAAATLRDERRLNVDFLDSLAICISTLQGNLFTTAFMSWLIAVGDWIRDQTA